MLNTLIIFFHSNLFIVYIIFISVILYLIITDDRFTFWRKILIIILNIIFLIISIYIDKSPILIIKDLFWYSLILNTSFILHVLILDRIFYWAWKKRRIDDNKKKEKYEYIGFLASRLSFTLSIWGIRYFFKELIENPLILFFYKYSFEYYLKKNNNLMNIFQKIYYFLLILQMIISLICMYFSTVFHNYSNLLLFGNKYKFNSILIMKNLIYFIIFFILAWIIGVPRLYVIWIYMGLLELYKILTFKYSCDNEEYEERDLKNKIIFIWKTSWVSLFASCHEKKYEELDNISKLTYHKFFIYDLIKFINKNIYSSIFYKYWYSLPYKDSGSAKYQILLNEIYKFYPWEELIKLYIELIYISNDIEWDGGVDLKEEIEEFIELINGDENLIYELYEKENI